MAEHPNRRHAVNSELWWDFTPGERVMTREGFAGVVTAVEDGPHPGSEQYIVELEGGMGGGEYGPSELRSMDTPSMATRVDRRPVEAPSSSPLDDTFHLASEDYPELSEILVERPPLQNVKRGSKTAGVWWHELSPQQRGQEGEADYNGTDPVKAWQCPRCETWNQEWSSQCRNCDYDVIAAQDAADRARTGGVIDRFLDYAVDKAPDSMKPRPGNDWSYDWCRFRKNSRCMYPRELDAAASKEAGYAVWIPVDRGYCPRLKWDDQRACPVGEPGPKSGDPNALPDATIAWEDGGQRVSIRTAAWADVQAKAKRIRSGGGVRILAVTDDSVTGQVDGDTGTYQTSLVFEPHTSAIAMWECGCPWSTYAWARSGRWKKYEGRMCAHALALSYEVQSRGFNGAEVTEDASTPEWAEGEVKIPGERGEIQPWRVGSLAVEADARARIRGAIRSIKALIGLDHVKLDDGSVVPVSEVVYPTYDPSAGLSFRPTASLLGAMVHLADLEEARHLGQIEASDPEAGMRQVEEACSKGSHTHSGLVIKSVDSGRVLLTQRTPYSEDPDGVRGRWEFPGGGIEDGQTAYESAVREFGEETGLQLPEGAHVDGCYENGPYIAIIVLVPNESWTTNAELLDFETMGIGWFHPDQIEGTDLAREEMDATEWEMVREALRQGSPPEDLDQWPIPPHPWSEAMLHEDPEPALPATDGATEDEGATTQKVSMKTFSPAEQRAIIEEGEHVVASNLDRLDISGTHYEALEAALAAQDGDPEELWL